MECGGNSAVGRGRADRWNVVVAVLLVVVGSTRPDNDQQHCYHQAPTVKPEAATTVVEF